MQDQLRPLFIGGFVLSQLAWIGAILYAGVLSLTRVAKPTDLDGGIVIFTVIGGILATNFGATLGIAKYLGGASLLSRVRSLEDDKFVWPQPNVIATYVYAVGLLIGALFILVDTDNGNEAQVLQEMAGTLVGALAGLAYVMISGSKKP